MLPQSKTDVAFLPLIDHPPAHHDTIKTAIDKGLTLMRAAGDDMLIFTADQQLYKIVKDIMFYQPSYFESVIPVLGGMHMVMNVIHATAVIMARSEMNEILAGTFGSVEKMLSGKKCPQKLPSHQNASRGNAPVYTWRSWLVSPSHNSAWCSSYKIVVWQFGKDSHHHDDLFGCRTRRRLGSSPLCCRSNAAL